MRCWNNVSVVMAMLLTACHPKEDDHDGVPWIHQSGIDALGWVHYPDGGWQEVQGGEEKIPVVQLGLKVWEGECLDGYVCFERQKIDDVRRSGAILDGDLLRRSELSGQYSVGRASGVILEHAGARYVVTAGHVTETGRYVLLDHHIDSAKAWGQGDVLVVPRRHVIECEFEQLGNDECAEGAIQACKLVQSTTEGTRSGNQDVPVMTSIGAGTKVRAVMHPLGLPMKKSSAEVPVSRCELACCWAHFDNATGGSGGAVLAADGSLAGIIRGTGVDERILGQRALQRQCQRREESPQRGQDECDGGQAFITATVIVRLLEGYSEK